MSVVFPHVRVGEPVRYQTLAVFPLFDGAMTPVEYTLSDEDIGSGVVTVQEVSEAGSVPDLLVETPATCGFCSSRGEELVGAKQNRILNTSLLIAAHSKIKIPVSCVEQGRWRYRSRLFGSSGSHCSSKLRYFLKSSVSRSASAHRGHRSDQGKVWEEVARQQSALGASSPSSAMSDTFLAYEGKVAEFKEKLRYVEGASGMAVAVGKKIVAVDLFDKVTILGGSGVKDQTDGAGFDVKLWHGGFLSWLWAVPCCFPLDAFFIGGLVTRLVRRGKIMGCGPQTPRTHWSQP